jgi:hypothetical protein
MITFLCVFVGVEFVYFDCIELCHKLAVGLLYLQVINIKLMYANILIVGTVCSVLCYCFSLPFFIRVYWICKLRINYYVGRT